MLVRRVVVGLQIYPRCYLFGVTAAVVRLKSSDYASAIPRDDEDDDVGEWRPAVVHSLVASQQSLGKDSSPFPSKALSPYSDMGDEELDEIEAEYAEDLNARAAAVPRVSPLVDGSRADLSVARPQSTVETQLSELDATNRNRLKEIDRRRAADCGKSAEMLMADYRAAVEKLNSLKNKSSEHLRRGRRRGKPLRIVEQETIDRDLSTVNSATGCYTVVTDEGRICQVLPSTEEKPTQPQNLPNHEKHVSNIYREFEEQQKKHAGIDFPQPLRAKLPVVDPRREHQLFHRAEVQTVTGDAVRDTKLIRFSHDEVVGMSVKESDKIDEELLEQEIQARAPLDSTSLHTMNSHTTRKTLEFFRLYPINLLIRARYVCIKSIRHEDGKLVELPIGDRPFLPIKTALKLAEAHGGDLIRVFPGIFKPNSTVSSRTPLCIIDDHRPLLKSFLENYFVSHDIYAGSVKPCYEVGYTGGTHPFAIRFKARSIAQYLFHKCPIRLSLRRFGTAREGFPVFETILRQIKKECAHLKAFHTASRIHASYEEITCYLHPSTSREKATEIKHPSPQQLRSAMEKRLVEAQREIHIENVRDVDNYADTSIYNRMLRDGTAWTFRDEGISLRKLRKTKMYMGLMPKGNKALYEARADVEMKWPFRTSTATSVESYDYPRESNLEQFNRGVATIAKRASMSISEMHDQNELESEPSTLSRFHYRLEGDAIELLKIKKEMGLRRSGKVPRFARGFATEGVKEPRGYNVDEYDNPSSGP